MRVRPRTAGIWLLAACAVPMASAQQGSVATKDTPLCVEIVGASVSAGFTDGPFAGGSAENRTVPLQTVIRAWLDETDARVQSRADQLMFQGAEDRGAQQIDRALRQQPSLVFAIDFLFWYGYGYVDGRDESAARQQRLQLGLAQLDRLPCPLIVGDLPDVHGAAARMIPAAQMPSVDLLGELNAAIAAWARQRPRVHLFPLRALVADMKTKGIELPLQSGRLATAPGALMQGDRLHATTVGMAWLGTLLQEEARQALPTAQADGLPKLTFEQFVDAIGADAELEELQQRPAKAAPPAKATTGDGGR